MMFPSSFAIAGEDNWVEQSQLFHYPGSGPGEPFQIQRRKVSVWNGEGRQDLEFSWEPVVPPGLDDEGKVSGPGELTWRLEGVPDYDHNKSYSVYKGELLGGKRHGQGQFHRQDGTLYIGEWKHDFYEGNGKLFNENGDVYDGEFHAGLFDGYGEQTLHTGEVYKGYFKNGARHGEGRILTADGRSLSTRWIGGKQVFVRTIASQEAGKAPTLRPAADQENGQAQHVEIGVSVNQEQNLHYSSRDGIFYMHEVKEDQIDIYPFDEDFLREWTGNGQTWRRFVGEWVNSAFLNLTFTAKDNFKFSVKSVFLLAEESVPFNKPVLEVGQNSGCVDFRPDFHFKNYGWGQVENPNIEFVFGNEDGSRKSDKKFSMSLPDFDKGADIVIRDAVAGMGTDVTSLDVSSMPVCPGIDQADRCLRDGMTHLPLGDLADFAYPFGDSAIVDIYGKITYRWTDHSGEKKEVSEEFTTPITLSTLTFEQDAAECGDLPWELPEAPFLLKFNLPSARSDYSLSYMLNLPADSRLSSVIGIASDRSSFHKFRLGAEFSDGTLLTSKPVNFYYYEPRVFTAQDEGLINNVQLPTCHRKQDSVCGGFVKRWR
ncbi:MORN repeat-containing protein [Labrenzia sp. MBR-25]|jgi:hypothetical protein